MKDLKLQTRTELISNLYDLIDQYDLSHIENKDTRVGIRIWLRAYVRYHFGREHSIHERGKMIGRLKRKLTTSSRKSKKKERMFRNLERFVESLPSAYNERFIEMRIYDSLEKEKIRSPHVLAQKIQSYGEPGKHTNEGLFYTYNPEYNESENFEKDDAINHMLREIRSRATRHKRASDDKDLLLMDLEHVEELCNQLEIIRSREDLSEREYRNIRMIG